MPLINALDKKVKHHALPHVMIGKVKMYGIVAFQHHLTGYAKSNDKMIVTIIKLVIAAIVFIILSFNKIS